MSRTSCAFMVLLAGDVMVRTRGGGTPSSSSSSKEEHHNNEDKGCKDANKLTGSSG